MPVCRSTLGALSRSRIPSTFSLSKTLVPFLYQTATLQPCPSAARPIAHRNASFRSNAGDDIPFEDDPSLPPRIDGVTPTRETTITGSERAAFEKLYKKFGNEEQPQDGIPFRHEIDQIADEWYEEDDDSEPPSSSLDSVFDAVLAGLPRAKQAPRANKRSKPAYNLETIAKRILKPEVDEARRKSREEAVAEAARIRGIKNEERERVHKLLEQAKTDKELWEILDREVFDLMRQLDLDGLSRGQSPVKTKQGRRSSTSESVTLAPSAAIASPDHSSDTPDPRILFPNFPLHLIHAARLLRTYFPASPLPLSILPTLKSLGRAPYALGATTSLYNILIRTAWIQHSSYDYIDQLLTDMDNGGIEMDGSTLDVIDGVLREYEDGRRGRLGEAIRAVWSMETFGQGAKRLQRWRDVVGRRLGAWAEKKTSEGRMVRKSDGFVEQHRNPRDSITFAASSDREHRSRLGSDSVSEAGQHELAHVNGETLLLGGDRSKDDGKADEENRTLKIGEGDEHTSLGARDEQKSV